MLLLQEAEHLQSQCFDRVEENESSRQRMAVHLSDEEIRSLWASVSLSG